MNLRAKDLGAVAFVGVIVVLAWIGPAHGLAQPVKLFFAVTALLSALLGPPRATSFSALAMRIGVSLALGALAGGIAWLVIETRTLIMSIALYFVLWWTLLFAVLPWGVRSQHDAQEVAPGTDPGAPVTPLLMRKVFATSLVAAIVLGVVLVFLYLRPIPNVLPFA